MPHFTLHDELAPDRVIHTDICFKHAPAWGPHLNLPLHTSKIHLCTDSLATMIKGQRNNTFPSYNCCNTLIQPVRVEEHYVALREIMSMDWINEIGIPFAYIEAGDSKGCFSYASSYDLRKMDPWKADSLRTWQSLFTTFTASFERFRANRIHAMKKGKMPVLLIEGAGE